ncbi:hypothetical protein B0H14DRAFT_3134429 [Mycena olivaceomarginata]|nr:hypothetical protein B0H14DRAFT_3134429 [Mycena olivaceomarginata]
MMGTTTKGNLVDGLGRHVACFGDGPSPRHLKVAPFQMAGRWPVTKTGDMGAQPVSQHNLPSDCCVVALLGYRMGTSLLNQVIINILLVVIRIYVDMQHNPIARELVINLLMRVPNIWANGEGQAQDGGGGGWWSRKRYAITFHQHPSNGAKLLSLLEYVKYNASSHTQMDHSQRPLGTPGTVDADRVKKPSNRSAVHELQVVFTSSAQNQHETVGDVNLSPRVFSCHPRIPTVEDEVGRWVDQRGLGRAGRGGVDEEQVCDDPGI